MIHRFMNTVADHIEERMHRWLRDGARDAYGVPYDHPIYDGTLIQAFTSLRLALYMLGIAFFRR